MIKIIAALVVALTLAGCSPATLITRQHVVYVPDQSKFKCEKLAQLPKPDGLKDSDVARLIAVLYTYNQQCYMSNQAMYRALQAAALEINAGGQINGHFVRRLVR